MPRLREEGYDVVVLGGGHAGLQAGLKAALLHHTAAILDRGPKYARSFYAPKMDNIPGHPDGISGHKLLDVQIAHVRKWEERVGYFTPARAKVARAVDGGFEVDFDWLMQPRTTRGRALVLALGVIDRIPEVGGAIKTIFPWANQALVDFCIFCDGHLMPGRDVATIGAGVYAAQTALDLLHFEPKSMVLLTNGQPLLADASEEQRAALTAELARRSIEVLPQPIAALDGIREKKFVVKFADGSARTFDKGFSALDWWSLNQEIPRSLGARFDPEGYVVTDEDCRVLAESSGEPIPGLYAVGDLRNGWNQIPEAWATAERAIIHAYGYYL